MGRRGTRKRGAQKQKQEQTEPLPAAEQQSSSVRQKRKRIYKRSAEALIRRAQSELTEGLSRQKDQVDLDPPDPTFAASLAATTSAEAGKIPEGVTKVSLESASDQTLSPSEEGSEAS